MLSTGNDVYCGNSRTNVLQRPSTSSISTSATVLFSSSRLSKRWKATRQLKKASTGFDRSNLSVAMYATSMGECMEILMMRWRGLSDISNELQKSAMKFKFWLCDLLTWRYLAGIGSLSLCREFLVCLLHAFTCLPNSFYLSAPYGQITRKGCFLLDK